MSHTRNSIQGHALFKIEAAAHLKASSQLRNSVIISPQGPMLGLISRFNSLRDALPFLVSVLYVEVTLLSTPPFF